MKLKTKHVNDQATASAGKKLRQQTAKEHQVGEAHYRKLFNYVPDGILIADSQSYYLDANASMCKMLGYTRDELVGLHASDIVVPTEIQHIESALNTIKADSDYRREWQFRRKDGSVFEAEVMATTMPDGNLLGVVRDITTQKTHEHEIARLSRLYAALSQINQAIVCIPTRDELFQKVCQVLVEYGGFQMAWVGWHDPKTQQLLPVAEFGDENGYIYSIKVYADDRPEGRGPSGIAFRTGRPYICNNLFDDPVTLPWRAEQQRRGFQAAAAFPIRDKNKVSGTLCIYATQEDFFHGKEIALLEEVAGDISFALENFEREELRRQAEVAVQNEKLFSDTMIDSMPGILYFYDSGGRFLRWNRNFESVSGYSGKEIARMHPLDFFSGGEKGVIKQRIEEVFEQGESFVEAPLLSKDGTTKPYFFTGRRVLFNNAACLVGMGVDIADRKQAEKALGESERKYRELVELANSIILRWNSEGQITFLNEFGQRFFGYSSEEIIGRHAIGTIVPFTESGGRDLQQLMKSICTDPEAFEQNINENMRRNGERVWISWANKIVHDEQSQFVEILSVGTDVTERLQAEREIKFKNTMLQTQQETSLDAILIVDENEKIISYNQQLIDLWQLSPQLVNAGLDAPVLESVIDQVEDPKAFVARIRYLYEHRDIKSHEEIRLKDGRIIDRYSASITGADGKYYGRIWYFRDITERKVAEARILGLNRVYAVLSGINTLIMHARNRDELFREACRITVEAGAFKMAWIGITDTAAGIVMPVASAGNVGDFFEVVPPEVFEIKEGGIGRAGQAVHKKKPMISNDFRNGKQKLMREGLEERGIHSFAVIPLIVEGEAIGVFALYSAVAGYFDEEEMRLLQDLAGDISFAIDYIDKQERLDYLVFYDVLTGLANRSLFLERVAQYIRSAESGEYKLVVGLIDLERFKNINDSLGRSVGDALLKQVAEWLTLNVGDASLLARVGADHFALVLPEEEQEGDAVHFFEKTIEVFLNHPFRLNDAVFRIAAKFGVALFPDNGVDAETLFKNAEAALKKAKASGERYLFYTQKMTETVAVKLTLENQLRQALDREEFVLHYQPKMNLESGKITSAEALIRWNDPNTGLVPPGHFIPILEETGLIYDVGRWALRQAVKDYLRWRTAGLATVRIAVNVSPLQLRHRDFIAEIEQVIGVDKHAAAGLELEITESVIMEDIKHSIDSLKTLRAMGVSIAIDDFGTGFSSLGYLAKLPADTLKIDRSFVIDMTSGPEGLALVSTIINLAHSLKLKVVAEGVETEEQSRLLRLLNCNEIQGYLFSKPVPAEIFEANFLTR